MTGHHTKNRLSLPLSSNGGRQAWLEGCLLKVPETGAEVRLRVLWDTGAAVNVLSESFYRALGSPSLLPCRDTVIRSLNGAIQSVCGAVTFTVTFMCVFLYPCRFRCGEHSRNGIDFVSLHLSIGHIDGT